MREPFAMPRFGGAALLAISFAAYASAQSTSVPLVAATTYSPTNVWTAAPTCSAGGTAPAGGIQGGVYMDGYGTYWQIACAYDWTGQIFYDNPTGYYP